MDWHILVTHDFKSDLLAINSYISHTLLVPETAKKQVNRILETAKGLTNMPLRNPLYENEPWKSRGLRKQIVDNYVIFYLPNEQTKEVVLFHIFYSKRNIDNILA